MTEEYFKSNEFYQLCLKACNFRFFKFYKNYIKDKEDMFSEAILKIYENKDQYFDLQGEELFYKLAHLANSAFEMHRLKVLKQFKRQSFSLDEQFADGKNSKGDLISVNNYFDTVENKENFLCLKSLLLEFLKDYDTKNSQIALEYFKGKNGLYLMKKYRKRSQQIVKIIRDFRAEFATFLKACGYIQNYNLFKADDEFGKKTYDKYYRKIQQQKRTGQTIDFNLYKHDFKIYELIRNNDLLTESAELLNKNREDLENIIYHKKRNSKLFLFEVQKLRQKLFPDYSLSELIFC